MTEIGRSYDKFDTGRETGRDLEYIDTLTRNSQSFKILVIYLETVKDVYKKINQNIQSCDSLAQAEKQVGINVWLHMSKQPGNVHS